MKRYILTEAHFIGGSLLAAGSIVTEADLGTYRDEKGKEQAVKAGSGLVEVDAKGQPVNDDDQARLRDLGVSAVPIEVAPVAPHAPNPTAPQALPPHGTGEVVPPGQYVAAQGVESDEAAEARQDQADALKPTRRGK
jgi:hypothetical protein